MHIGQRIKASMKAKGISNKQVALNLGVTEGAVSNWFTSGRISKDNLVRVAEMLGVTTEELITGEPPSTAHAHLTSPPGTLSATGGPSNQALARIERAGAATNNEALQQQAVELLSAAMDMMDDAQRELMAGKLASWARAPDSPKIKKSIADSLASASKPKNTND